MAAPRISLATAFCVVGACAVMAFVLASVLPLLQAVLAAVALAVLAVVTARVYERQGGEDE